MKKIIVCLAMLFSVSYVSAFEIPKDIKFKTSLGYTRLLNTIAEYSGNDSQSKSGFSFNVQALKDFSHLYPKLSLGAEIGYTSLYSVSFDAGWYKGNYKTYAFPLLALGKLDLGKQGRFDTYAIGGIGLYYTRTNYEYTLGGTNGSESKNKTHLGLMVGYGGTTPINEKYNLDLAARYLRINGDDTLGVLNFTVGVGF